MDRSLSRKTAVPVTVATAIALLFLPGSVPAGAAACASHGDVRSILSDRHQETAKGVGLLSDSKILEIYTSEDGSFSIVVTTADGNTCVVAVGEAWEFAEDTTGSMF
jgi:hypothetical protein